MSRRPFIAGNWKMNLGPAAAADLATQLRHALMDDTVDTMHPPFHSRGGGTDHTRVSCSVHKTSSRRHRSLTSQILGPC